MLDDDAAIDFQIVEGWWKDTEKSEDVLEGNRIILEDQPAELASTGADEAGVSGRVDLAESASTEAGFVVRGPVSIVEGTTIRSGAYVGFTVVNACCCGTVDDNTRMRLLEDVYTLLWQSDIEFVERTLKSKAGRMACAGDRLSPILCRYYNVSTK